MVVLVVTCLLCRGELLRNEEEKEEEKVVNIIGAKSSATRRSLLASSALMTSGNGIHDTNTTRFPSTKRVKRRRMREYENDDNYRWGPVARERDDERDKEGKLEALREDIRLETKKLEIALKEERILFSSNDEEAWRKQKETNQRDEQEVQEHGGGIEKWPLLKQHEEMFERFCGGEGSESGAGSMREVMGKLRKQAESYDESDSNGNLVIFEAYNPFWNGFGNNMRRWLNLFVVASRFDSFASYFDFGACGMEEYGRNAENDGVEGKTFYRRGKDGQSACQFDPGMFFKGDGFDWQWTPKRANENPERLSLASVTRNATILCEEDVSDDVRDCKLYDDKDLDHRRRLYDNGDDATYVVKPLASSGRMSREEIDRAEGAEAKIKAANADWLREWFKEEVARDVDRKGVRVKLTIHDVFVMQREGEVLFNVYGIDGDEPPPDLGDPELPKACYNRHFFRPREHVKEAIEEVFEKSSSNGGGDMKKWRSCAAIHLRTGFADHQAQWVAKYRMLSENKRKELEAKYPCRSTAGGSERTAERFVDALDETFRKCEPDYSNERICTLWHQKNEITKHVNLDIENESNVLNGRLKTFDVVQDCCGSSFREPDVADAMERCGFVPEGMYPELEVKKKNDDFSSTSPVRAALTCALRASKFHLESLVEEDNDNSDDDDSDDEAFGVFLLGDSPTFIKAVPKLPNIGKYFAHQQDPDTVGVTMGDSDCSGTSCVVRKKGEKHLSWMRSVVDAYVASLCEVTVQLPGSSFANGAIHQLRAPGKNRTSSAFLWSGEVVLGQHLATRDETTNEIARETKIGYDGNLENYVALGAAHCKTID